MKVKAIAGILILIAHIECFGQTSVSSPPYPEVGKPMPDFVLFDVVNYKTRQIRLQDFRGKWLILDWWSRYCTGCIESFPKYNELQKEYNDQIQFVYVAYNGSQSKGISDDEVVRDIYKRAKKRLNLTMPFAFDSTLYQRYHLGKVPYIVVIDPQGVVRGITWHLDSKIISDFITNKQPAIVKAYRHGLEAKYNDSIPLLTYNNAGADTSFLFRSLLTQSSVDVPSAGIWNVMDGKIELVQYTIERMLLSTYFGDPFVSFNDSLYGKCYPKILIEHRDHVSIKEDSLLTQVPFSYSLIVPKNKANDVFMTAMVKRDLNDYFDIQVDIESRSMPCWRVTATESAKEKLKTKGIGHYENRGAAGFSCGDCTIKEQIIPRLKTYSAGQIFLDETGITGKIDISINAMLTDFEDFKNALSKAGLELVAGKKEMKVIVVKK